MDSNSDKAKLERCPHCQREFKQLSKHMPFCKKKQNNEAGTTSVTARHPTGHNISAKEEENNPDLRDEREKQLQICDDCGFAFIHLLKHKPHCKGLKLQSTDNKSPLSKSKQKSPQTSATKNSLIENSSTIGIIISEGSNGSTQFRSTRPLVTEKGETKGNETCINCGKTFKSLAQHIRYCKLQCTIKDTHDISEVCMVTNGSDDLDTEKDDNRFMPTTTSIKTISMADKETENMSRTNNSDKVAPKLKLHDSEPSPYKKILDRASAMKQDKPKTSCPHCGKHFSRLPMHVRACEKRADYSSVPTFTSESDTLYDSSKQIKQSQIKFQRSGQKEHISKKQAFVDDLPSLTRQQEISHKPLATEPASFARITYSEDPKAELDKFQEENKIVEPEIKEANKVVTEMQKYFGQYLNKHSDFKWTICLAGSYSDETKIKKADEFDFIMCMDIKCRAECLEEPDKLGYCLVVPDFDKNVHQNIAPLMTDNYLDPSLVKTMAFDLFDTVISDTEFHKGRRINRLHRKAASPAFTITYESGGGKMFDIDLVPAIHFNGWPQISAIKDWQPKRWHEHDLEVLKKDFLAVAREHPNAEYIHQGKLLWRLSFTNTERMLWLSVDKNSLKPTCRKEILKLLKGILEKCKNENRGRMPNLSSFHLRTFMLHQYDQRQDDKDWLEERKRTCLRVCIDYLQDSLKIKNMSNYYVHDHNVFQVLEDEEINIFQKALNEAKNMY